MLNLKKVKELISMDKDLLHVQDEMIEEQYSLVAEQILNKSLIDYKREQLMKEIDVTLRDGNKEEFIRLTEQLKAVLSIS